MVENMTEKKHGEANPDARSSSCMESESEPGKVEENKVGSCLKFLTRAPLLPSLPRSISGRDPPDITASLRSCSVSLRKRASRLLMTTSYLLGQRLPGRRCLGRITGGWCLLFTKKKKMGAKTVEQSRYETDLIKICDAAIAQRARGGKRLAFIAQQVVFDTAMSLARLRLGQG